MIIPQALPESHEILPRILRPAAAEPHLARDYVWGVGAPALQDTQTPQHTRRPIAARLRSHRIEQAQKHTNGVRIATRNYDLAHCNGLNQLRGHRITKSLRQGGRQVLRRTPHSQAW